MRFRAIRVVAHLLAHLVPSDFWLDGRVFRLVLFRVHAVASFWLVGEV